MRERISDWQRDWIDANGKTEDLEVVIKDGDLYESAPCIYEGSFAGIPEELVDRKVVEWSKIVLSSKQERVGAYSLTVEGSQDERFPDWGCRHERA